MRRLLTGALALALLTGTAAMAQPDRGAYDQQRGDQQRSDQQRGDQQHGYQQPADQRGAGRYGQGQNGDGHGQDQRHWARGQRMPSTYYRDSSRYVDYRAYHLSAPRRGYRWVRTDDNNYAMVAIATGLIASIVAANH
jgi:Ni/Co efflux regulator RcnB